MSTDVDTTELLLPATEPGSAAAGAIAAYLARLAPNSQRMVLSRLRAVAPILAGPSHVVAWHDLGYERLQWLRDRLQSSGASPHAINVTLVVVRGIAGAAAELGLISEEAAVELRRVRGISMPVVRTAPGRVCSSSEVAAIFAVCWQDRTIGGIRDLALLYGIYRAGLSTTELAGLSLND